MITRLLATSYPGGAIVVISALLWLVLTVLAPFTLFAGCFGVWLRFIEPTTGKKCLLVTIFSSITSLGLLALEAGAIGWDAFFLLNDEAIFFDQFPGKFLRGGLNLLTLVISWLVYRKVNSTALV